LAVNKEAVNFNDCIQQILLVYTPIAKAKNIHIKSDIQHNIQINADQNFLATILRNLIDNAIKNTAPNLEILITANFKLEVLKLTIQNPTNISDEKFTTLETFFTSKKEWQVGEKRMGLGLILIKEFTKKMNGCIEVKKENEVISFELSFPIQDR